MSNLKKLKLKLTIALMNNEGENNILQTIRDFMNGVKEAGKFIGTKITNQPNLDQSKLHKIYALKFENMTLDLRLITNSNGSRQVLNGFQLR